MLSIFGWNREMRRRYRKDLEREQARRQELLAQAGVLRPVTDVRRRSRGRGQIAVLAAGTYSSKLFAPLSHEFVRAGAADFLNTPLLIELDAERLEMCLADMAPEVRKNLVLGTCPHFPGGLAGGSIAEVEAAYELWLPDVLDATKRWLGQMQREQANDPAVLLVVLSPGGHTALLRPAMEAFRERYPHVPIYVVTVIDQKSPVRHRIPELHEYYNRDGLVRGFIETDNRRDYKRSDTGLAILFPALVGGSWIGSRGMDIWNAFSYIFPSSSPGRVATISVWGEPVPVYHIPAWEKSLPEVFYTTGRLVEEKAMRGIKAVVTRPELQALPLEPAPAGNVRVCCVAAPIVPEHFGRNAERIDEGLGPWLDAVDPDLALQYASIGMPMSQHTEQAPLVVVYLQPLAGGTDDVDLFALGAPVDPKFQPKALLGNGHHPAERTLLGQKGR